jgi:phosphoglycerate dehydrogenase-like enzyme
MWLPLALRRESLELMSDQLFDRIAVVDNVDLPSERHADVQALSRSQIVFPSDDPVGDADASARMRDADAVMVSWRTPITKEMFAASPRLRFIAMGGSAFAVPEECPVDLSAARDNGVVVSTLGQYGDEATAEWVIGTMIAAAAHFGELKWKPERCELFGKTLAVIGMGHMGREVARRALGLGMRVTYWSRTRKPEMEERGCVYRELHEALGEADVISLHIGKGPQLFGADEFASIREGALFVNTSNGPLLEPDAFQQWIRSGRNAVIFDKDSHGSLSWSPRGMPKVFVSPQSAGDSSEMKHRKVDQLCENMRAFLDGSPLRVAQV